MMRAFGLCAIIQLAAIAVALSIFRIGTTDAWITAGIYLVVSNFIFAYWIKLLSDIRIKDTVAAEREKFLNARERLKVKNEQEKLNMVRDTHKLISKETARASARANTKIGAIAVVAVAGGITLIAAQMLALGVLTLSTAGGGLAGYLVRIRQEKNTLQKRLAQERLDTYEEEMDKTVMIVPALPDASKKKS